MGYREDSQQHKFTQEELEEWVRSFKQNPLVKLSAWIDFESFRRPQEVAFGYDRTVSALLQSFYNLSDDQMEYQINDRISFRQFWGMTSSSAIPDAKTIWLSLQQPLHLKNPA